MCEHADRCGESPRGLYLSGLVFKMKARERHKAGGSALGPPCSHHTGSFTFLSSPIAHRTRNRELIDKGFLLLLFGLV